MEYRSESEWTFEQALADQDALPRDRVQGPEEPIFRWFAMRSLDAYQKRYEHEKLGFDVLAAVRQCANHDVVMPNWLSYAFCWHYDKVLNCETDSWDVAFGRPYKKGAHIDAMRAARLGRFQVHRLVVNELARNPTTVIDNALFEKIRADLPYSASVAQRYYYEAINELGLHNPKKKQ